MCDSITVPSSCSASLPLLWQLFPMFALMLETVIAPVSLFPSVCCRVLRQHLLCSVFFKRPSNISTLTLLIAIYLLHSACNLITWSCDVLSAHKLRCCVVLHLLLMSSILASSIVACNVLSCTCSSWLWPREARRNALTSCVLALDQRKSTRPLILKHVRKSKQPLISHDLTLRFLATSCHRPFLAVFACSVVFMIILVLLHDVLHRGWRYLEPRCLS